MATIRELLGDKYKDDMTIADVEAALQGMNLANLSSGDYVSKAKWQEAVNEASKYKMQAEGEKSRLDAAVASAKEKYKAELDEKYKAERTADRRKRAREKAYEGLSDEQKAVYDAMLKDDDLSLDDQKDEYKNWDEVAKPIKEKFKTLFPADPTGSHGRAGLGGSNGGETPKADEFAELRKIR